MKSKVLLCFVFILMALAITANSVWASQEFKVSCEGTLCSGGGVYNYQYTLKNVSGSLDTLKEFFVGTEDINIANYSFTVIPGFTATIVPNDASVTSVTYTTGQETSHGILPPQSGGVPSGAIIYWYGSAIIPDQGTITFSFEHPNAPWDQEWFAHSDAGWTISQIIDVIAGPTGVYTYGYVHAPSPEPAPAVPVMSTLTMVILSALLLLTAAVVLVRWRRYTLEKE